MLELKAESIPARGKVLKHCKAFEICESREHLVASLAAASAEFGFSHYAVMMMAGEDISLSGSLLVTNWPAELVHRYDLQGAQEGGAIAAALRRSTKPFVMSYGPDYPDGASPPEDIRLLSEYDLGWNVFLPAHHYDGRRGAVGFSRKRRPMRLKDLSEINLMASFIFESACLLSKPGENAGTSLTPRELECLKWTAYGKTSSEIGVILNLSEHTINNYLTMACRKLDAVNRSHAVFKAASAGYLI